MHDEKSKKDEFDIEFAAMIATAGGYVRPAMQRALPAMVDGVKDKVLRFLAPLSLLAACATPLIATCDGMLKMAGMAREERHAVLRNACLSVLADGIMNSDRRFNEDGERLTPGAAHDDHV